MAFIIEDEEPWQDLLDKWFKAADFDTKIAGSKKEALTLLEDLSEPPDFFSVDISLSQRASNRDGLTIVDIILHSYPNSKVVITTSQKDRAGTYVGKVSDIIEKVDSSTGKALNRDFFINKIKSLLKAS